MSSIPASSVRRGDTIRDEQGNPVVVLKVHYGEHDTLALFVNRVGTTTAQWIAIGNDATTVERLNA